MQRAIGRYLTREMAALGLVEAAVSFAAIYAVTTLAGSSLSLPDFIEKTPHDHLALAAVLILLAGAIGLTIGLCRTISTLAASASSPRAVSPRPWPALSY